MVQRIVSQVALILILSLAVTDATFAGAKCRLQYEVQNKDRMVANSNLTQECGGGCGHSAPWGNWGVDSSIHGETIGTRGNKHQFDGWQRMEDMTQYQWNSCTSDQEEIPTGDSRWYNYPALEFTSQVTDTDGKYDINLIGVHEKVFSVRCPDGHGGGCADLLSLGVFIDTKLFELDPFPCPGDELVTSWSFGLNSTLSCTVDQCEVTANWFLKEKDGISARWALSEFSASLDDTECESVGEVD